MIQGMFLLEENGTLEHYSCLTNKKRKKKTSLQRPNFAFLIHLKPWKSCKIVALFPKPFHHHGINRRTEHRQVLALHSTVLQRALTWPGFEQVCAHLQRHSLVAKIVVTAERHFLERTASSGWEVASKLQATIELKTFINS